MKRMVDFRSWPFGIGHLVGPFDNCNGSVHVSSD